MGLDMYLLAKIKNQESAGCITGAGGFLPVAPKTDKEEIGYWRKFYDLDNYILDMVCEDDEDPNCVEYELTKEQVENCLQYSFQKFQELSTKDCNEEGYWERGKFEDSIVIFNKALEILNQDEANKIYYMCWY